MRLDLGTTPDNICYDPQRPSWLPYAINDLSEAACFRSSGKTLTPPLISGSAPPTMPLPPPPSVNLVTGPSSDPNAVYAGTDSQGNPIYAVPESPQQNQQDIKNSLQAWFEAQAASPDNQPVDCTVWYNSWFNPACPPTPMTWLVPALVIGGGIWLLLKLKG